MISENLHRRHLSAGQKAALALEAEKLYATEAKEKQRKYYGNQHDNKSGLTPIPAEQLEESRHKRESATRAAQTVGVGSTAVKQAKKVAELDPALYEQVKSGAGE